MNILHFYRLFIRVRHVKSNCYKQFVIERLSWQNHIIILSHCVWYAVIRPEGQDYELVIETDWYASLKRSVILHSDHYMSELLETKCEGMEEITFYKRLFETYVLIYLPTKIDISCIFIIVLNFFFCSKCRCCNDFLFYWSCSSTIVEKSEKK